MSVSELRNSGESSTADITPTGTTSEPKNQQVGEGKSYRRQKVAIIRKTKDAWSATKIVEVHPR